MKKRITILCAVFMMVGTVWAEDVDILTKIHTVFEGEHTKDEIQALLDTIIAAYGLPHTDKTYEQVASVALSLRKENNVPEMDTLACTAQLPQGEYAIQTKFTEAAAMCVTLLAANDPAILAAKALQLQYKVLELEDLQSAAQTQSPPPATPAAPITKPAPPQGIPAEIDSAIREAAAARYPDDNNTQLYVVKQQQQAYLDLQAYTADLPDADLQAILKNAAQRYSEDYNTRLYVVNQQVEAYLALQSYTSDIPDEALQKILQNAAARYPEDYNTRLYVVNQEVDAYKELHP